MCTLSNKSRTCLLFFIFVVVVAAVVVIVTGVNESKYNSKYPRLYSSPNIYFIRDSLLIANDLQFSSDRNAHGLAK